MESNILFHIIKETAFSGQKVLIEEFVTDHYLYTKTAENDFLYRKDTNQMYQVDHANKRLINLSFTSQQNQVQQLRQMLSKLDVENKTLHGKVNYSISGKGTSVVLNGQVVKVKVSDLDRTVHASACRASSKASLIDIPIEGDELIELSKMYINLQGNIIDTTISVVEVANRQEYVSQYDYLCSFELPAS